MKILHIAPSYYPARFYGGPIYSVHALNKALVRTGADVTVFTTNADGPGLLDVPLGTPVMQDGVRIFYFPLSFPRVWFYSGALHRALKARVMEFDLVHITSVFLAVSYLGSRYAGRAGIPYVISPRGSLMTDPLTRKSSFKKSLYLRFMEKRNLSGASAIHFTAPREEAEYRLTKLPLQKGFVIPNGIEAEEIPRDIMRGAFKARLGLSTDSRIILYHGRLGWKKGFDTLIPAFAGVAKKESGAVLVIAEWSDEGYKDKIRTLIQSHGLGGRVAFTGRLEGKERAEAFVDTDVFALTSYSENFGIAIGQAMAAGVPVVVTDGVAISGDIQKSGAGLVAPKQDDAVANAILAILGNPDARATFGECGKRLVKEKYSYEKIAAEFIKEYSGCITKK